MRVTSHITVVGGSGLSHPDDAAVYLVASRGEAALIDAGCGLGTGKILANCRAAGVDPHWVRYLLLTHCHYDHTGGAAAIRAHTGCDIVAHELDACFLEAGDSQTTAASWYGARTEPLSVDIKVSGKEQRFRVGDLELTLLHTPGHSPGSAVVTVVSDGKLVVFGQDVHGPLHQALRSCRADYEQSLKRLLALQADVLCEGHYGVIVGKERVRDFIEEYV